MAGSGKRRKKKKQSLSFSVNPTKPQARIRKKAFPPMYVARPGALLSTFDGGIRSGHAGLFYIETQRIVNKMVRDIMVFRSRSRRWPAVGKEHTLSFSANPTKNPAGANNTNVLELSLSVVYGLETSTKTLRKWRWRQSCNHCKPAQAAAF